MAGDPPKTRRRRTPYQRIVRAAELGMGVKLTPEDVLGMSQDNAIQTLAYNDDLHWRNHSGGKCEPGLGCPWCAEERREATEGRR